MNQRQRRNKHLRTRQQRVRPQDLAPGIAAGLTQGPHAAEEAKELFAVQKGQSHIETVAGPGDTVGRVPVWRAVLRDDTHAVWEEAGILRRNHEETVPPDVLMALKAGHICLRCKEPHPEAFPDQCDVCGYPMRERQAMDVAVEFRGETSIGPAIAIGQWEAEQQERVERAEHERRKKEGASPMVAVSRRILSPGVKKLRGLSGRAHATEGLLKAAHDAEVKRGKKD